MTKILPRIVYFIHVKALFLLFELITNVSFRFSLLRPASNVVCGWLRCGSCHFRTFYFTSPNSSCGEG